jgi:phosphoenolpyruvate carboxykinase (ATP)
VTVWLVNTGWTGGPYGVGSRMKLSYTRAMINAALSGELDNADYIKEPVFGVQMPTHVPNVPDEVLNPRNTWEDKAAFDEQIRKLAGMFVKNFEQFADQTPADIRAAAPNPNA